MDRKKKTGTIGVIVTAIILIIIVILTNTKKDNWSFASNVFGKVVMPFQSGLIYLKNKISKNDNFFVNMDELKQENENLKNKNIELEKSLREHEIIKEENDTLKEYVNLKNKYSQYTTKPAYVIQKDFDNFSKLIEINLGKKDGIDVNMTVISEKG